MKTTATECATCTSNGSGKSLAMRTLSLVTVIVTIMTFMGSPIFNLAPISFMEEAAITAEAAGGGKGKKEIVTTSSYTTTTETETTTSTTESTGGKKTVSTTESYTTDVVTTGGKKTVATTTSYTTTTSETTTTTTTTTTSTTTTTTTTATQTSGKKTISTTTTYTTTSGKKTVPTTSPYTTYTTYNTGWGKKGIVTTSIYDVEVIAPLEAYTPAISADTVRPHKGYMPKSQGWFYFANTWEDAAKLAQYNGYTLSDSVHEGWIDIPNGMSCKVETYLYVEPGKTLWSTLGDRYLSDIIMEYNANYYGSCAYVPAGLALYVNDKNIPEVTTAETTMATTTTEEISTTDASPEVTDAETTSTTEETSTTQATTTTKAMTISEETTTIVNVKDENLANLEKELAELKEALQNKEEVINLNSIEKEKLEGYIENVEKIIGNDMSSLIAKLRAEQIGFAIGTDSKILVSFNADTVFPVNCIGKPVVVVLLLETLERKGISLDTKVQLIQSDVVGTTWMSEKNGYHVGQEVTLLDCCYCAISLSDNVGYNVIKRYLKNVHGIDVDTWRSQMFHRIQDNGSYGRSTARNMYSEAQYVLKYLNSKSKYSKYMSDWLNMEGLYYDSVFLNGLDVDFKYTGFKIGWYMATQTEMVFMQDQYGNWYLAIFLTKSNGDSIIDTVSRWFSDEYRKLKRLIALGGVTDKAA